MSTTECPAPPAPARRDGRTAVDKALCLLLSFGDDACDGVSVIRLARRADMSKSTAFRLLHTLQNHGVVERAGTAYRLGVRLHELGRQVYAPDHDRIRELATPFLVDLCARTHQTAHLAVLRGTDAVYLHKLYGPHTVPPPTRVGGTVPAHCTAGGKVLLAYDDSAPAEDTLVRRTAHTITDPAVLRRHLAAVRADGVAFDAEEAHPGIRCVAAPIFSAPGQAVAALSVTAPSSRFDARAHAAVVRELAHQAGRCFAADRRRHPVA